LGLSYVTSLRCVACGREHPRDASGTCTACGVEGILDVVFDYDRVKLALSPETLWSRPRDAWRCRELIPIHPDSPLPPLHVGWTPIYDAPRLATFAGVKRLHLKDEGRNPTASFKDRASSVGVVKAQEAKARTIACASTGNAASSLAGFAASVGLPSVIFVPERAPDPKVTQLLVFGAHVIKVKGTYDQAWELCQAACARWGWYNRNCAVNPFLIEGKKTAGHEIAEQVGAEVPDWVAVSVGDGCTIAGVWKGLREMHRLGFLPRLPRMLGVQAEGAQPITHAFRTRTPFHPSEATTFADSICVGHPRNWRKALAAIEESHGSMVAVADGEIVHAMRMTARLGAVFGEPAGAASVAGILHARTEGIVSATDSVLALVTGSGLKDVRSAQEAAGTPWTVEPAMTPLEELLRRNHVIGP